MTESMTDEMYIEKERKACAERCNMLARRFVRCTRNVKLTCFANLSILVVYFLRSLWVK